MKRRRTTGAITTSIGRATRAIRLSLRPRTGWPPQGPVRCEPGCPCPPGSLTSASTLLIQGDEMTTVERKPLTVRIARWSATHPWRAMALWVVFVAAAIVFGNMAGTTEATDAGNVGETSRAQQMIKDGNFPKDPSVERVFISSRSGPLDPAAAKAAAGTAAARLRALPDVSTVDAPVPSPDGTM